MTNIALADNFIASLGLDAYRVGGSVRDELLGRAPKDADYMVRGIPMHELKEALLRGVSGSVRPLKLRDGRQAGVRYTNRHFGTIEIVLPRTEVSVGPGHRDFEIVVEPDLSLIEDAERRDFTFNALYKQIASGAVMDPTGRGLHDLERRMIHTTHPDSFRDDPLRTLRALRFVSRGFDLSHTTYLEMVEHADVVNGLTSNGYASGTVLDELSKILMGARPEVALRIARDTRVLGTLFPELVPMLGFDQQSRYHDLTTDEHTFEALHHAASVDAPLRVRVALLFHDSGKPESAWTGDDGRRHYYAKGDKEDHEVVSERLWREAATRIGAPKRLREDVATLIRHHMVGTEGRIKPQKVHRMRVQFGDELLRDLLLHRACDVSGKGHVNLEKLRRVLSLENIRQEAEKRKIPASVGDLKVGGADAKDLGLDGPEVGTALRAVLDEVVVQPDDVRMSRAWQLGRLSKVTVS